MKIYVDVDGTLYKTEDVHKLVKESQGKLRFWSMKKNNTLVGGAIAKVPLREKLIDFIKANQENNDFYCWSAGGAEYARAFCKTHKIMYLFKAFLTKQKVESKLEADALCIDDCEKFSCLTLFV